MNIGEEIEVVEVTPEPLVQEPEREPAETPAREPELVPA